MTGWCLLRSLQHIRLVIMWENCPNMSSIFQLYRSGVHHKQSTFWANFFLYWSETHSAKFIVYFERIMGSRMRPTVNHQSCLWTDQLLIATVCLVNGQKRSPKWAPPAALQPRGRAHIVKTVELTPGPGGSTIAACVTGSANNCWIGV